MVTATQMMQHDVSLDQRPLKCLEILLRAEKEAEEVILDIQSAITDHDVRGIELKAEAASLRAARGKQALGERTHEMTMKTFKLLDVTSTAATTPRSTRTTTMTQMTVGYRRPRPVKNTYINLVLSSNACAIAILHCIESSSCKVIYTIGWVSVKLRKKWWPTKQQMKCAASYSNVRSLHIHQTLDNLVRS
jgi:hypothetical protein